MVKDRARFEKSLDSKIEESERIERRNNEVLSHVVKDLWYDGNLFSSMAIFWFGLGYEAVAELQDGEFVALNKRILKKARKYLRLSNRWMYLIISLIPSSVVGYLVPAQAAFSFFTVLFFMMLGFALYDLSVSEAFNIDNLTTRDGIKYFVKEGGVDVRDRDVSRKDHKFGLISAPRGSNLY